MRRDLGTSTPLKEADTEAEELRCSELRMIFQSDPMAVRQALQSVVSGLHNLQLNSDDCGTVELVLAEVMNNIGKHAYRDCREGLIELRLSHLKNGIRCILLDDGLPMPDGNPPMGKNHNLNCSIKDLPEGGFGWFLIREYAEDLQYQRVNNKNKLSFRLSVGHKLITN